MLRVGVPANFHGKKGKSGRRPLSNKTDLLKGILVDAVLEEVQILKTDSEDIKLAKQLRSRFWAEKFANKLLPQTVEGTGNGGEIVFKVVNYE